MECLSERVEEGIWGVRRRKGEEVKEGGEREEEAKEGRERDYGELRSELHEAE